MKIPIKSLKLLDRLQQMQSTANVGEFAVKLQVPPELFWWTYLEYGTGIRGDYPSSSYTIEVKNAKMLHFFSAATGQEVFTETIHTDGIPAFHMVTSIYDSIMAYQRQFIRESLQSTGYNLELVKEMVYNTMMPKIKEMIVESFADNLPNHIRDLGRLTMTATKAFEAGLEIV